MKIERLEDRKRGDMWIEAGRVVIKPEHGVEKTGAILEWNDKQIGTESTF